MSLDIQVVKVVCVFHLAGFGALQPLDDLGFHLHGYVRRQQGEQEPLLREGVGGRRTFYIITGTSESSLRASRIRTGAKRTTLSSKLKQGE